MSLTDQALGDGHGPVENLSDAECALAVILMDQSGLDFAEFAFVNESSPQGCFRAYPYQWPWWTAKHKMEVDQGARSIGKSERIGARACVFNFNFPGEEHVLVAPEGTHLDALTDRIEARVSASRLLTEMTKGGRGGITHRPFKIIWKNGARTFTRLPQKSGIGVKGCMAAGTKILTKRGVLPIEKVKIGDRVWSHKGRWVPVLATENFVDDTYQLVGDGSRPVIVSSEHRIYGAEVLDIDDEQRPILGVPQWVSVDMLEGDDLIDYYWLAPLDCPDNNFRPDPTVGVVLEEFGLVGFPIWRVADSGEQEVFNLVTGDGSYLAEGILHHNTHPVWLDVDEAQDLTPRTWLELPEVVRWEIPGARWSCHGVSKGVQDEFYKITHDKDWFVHKISALHKPTRDLDEMKKDRALKIRQYGGSEQSPDFIRNYYGEHGEAANRIFVLARLKACQDDRDPEFSKYNSDEYYQRTVIAEDIAAAAGSMDTVETSSEAATAALLAMVDFPRNHGRYKVTWAGMDVGLVSDPSEIIVCGEYVPDAKERAEHKKAGIAIPDTGETRLKVITRIRLLRVPTPLQADLVMWLIDFYGPKAFALDGGGNGFPLFQELQKRAGASRLMVIEPPEEASPADKASFEERKTKAQGALTVIKNYKFGSKHVIGFDEEKAAELKNPTMDELVEKAGIKQEIKTRATDVLREWVDTERLLLPLDDEMINELNGQTWTYSQEPVDAYGKRRMVFGGVGPFHILDAFRFLALAYSQDRIEKLLATKPKQRKPVYDSMGLNL